MRSGSDQSGAITPSGSSSENQYRSPSYRKSTQKNGIRSFSAKYAVAATSSSGTDGNSIAPPRLALATGEPASGIRFITAYGSPSTT